MSFEAFAQPIDILLVKDNCGNVGLTLEILKDSKIRNKIIVAKKGEEALAYLYKQGEHQNAVRPDLVLLDLNLLIKKWF